jgi:uncharacterized protein
VKYSQYNTLIALTESVSALYNALSDKFVVIKNAAIGDLTFIPVELQKRNAPLYEELKQAAAIVENQIDEYACIIKCGKEMLHNDTEFKLIFNPTLDCNLRCWYCYENHVKGSHINDATANKIRQFIVRIFENNPNVQHFHLCYFGGEPLLSISCVKEITSFISDYCKSHNIRLGVSFTSNGVLINEKTVQFLKSCTSDASFQITLDGGKPFHDKTRFLTKTLGTYDKILQNVRLLLQHQIAVILRINFTQENIASVASILENIKTWSQQEKEYVKIDFQRVWQDNSIPIDIDGLLGAFHEAGFNASSPEHSLDAMRDPCYADKLNQLLINYDGNVYKCTARDFTETNRDGYLNETGEVVWTKLTPAARIERKMSIPICKTCAILPLCGGGCIQKTIEYQRDNECMYNYDEAAKKEIVLNRFYNYFVKNSETSTGI